MAFGDGFPARVTNETEVIDWIKLELERDWDVKKLGDCTVGIWNGEATFGQLIPHVDEGTTPLQVRLVTRPDFDNIAPHLDVINSVGYVGVRDATPWLPPRTMRDSPLPH
jgi:hypothetical protein